MSNLHQIIYLHTTMYDGSTHDGSIDAGVGAYLHIVLDDGNAYLWNLLVSFLCRLETEAVCTDDTTCMKHTTIAHLTVVVDDCITVYLCIGTDLGIPAYRDVRMKNAAFAYLHAFSNGDERPDVALLAYLCRRVDESEVADAFTLGFHAFIYLQELCHSLTSIRHLDERRLYLLLRLEVLVDEHHATLRLVDVLLILIVGQETDAARLAFLYLGEVVYLGFGVAYDGATYQPCYHLCCKFHDYIYYLTIYGF